MTHPNRFGAAAVALLITACTGWSDVDAGVATLKGKPIQYAIERIGMPATEQVIAGRKVYIWGTRGTIPAQDHERHGEREANTDHPVQDVPATDPYCTLKLVVNADEIVTHVQYEGNLTACERYSKLAPKKASPEGVSRDRTRGR
jgi:hypothetical protein